MPTLSAHPNLDQLRHQAKDLLRAAKAGDADALNELLRASVGHARLCTACYRPPLRLRELGETEDRGRRANARARRAGDPVLSGERQPDRGGRPDARGP
jgi:hypothetical protein